VIESFQSPFEEIKSAASYALGNIAVGNLSKYLPFILNQIDNQQKKQYLLLHSLKEVFHIIFSLLCIDECFCA
jgi:cullin-associated NEDD8-dissociated protein 1